MTEKHLNRRSSGINAEYGRMEDLEDDQVEDIQIVSLDSLPFDVVLMVFTFLRPSYAKTIGAVCKNWVLICSSPRLWKSFCVKINPRATIYKDPSNQSWEDLWIHLTTITWDVRLTDPRYVSFSRGNSVASKYRAPPDVNIVFGDRPISGKRCCLFSVLAKRDEMLIGITNDHYAIRSCPPHQLTHHPNTWALFDGSRFAILQSGGTFKRSSFTYGAHSNIYVFADMDLKILVFSDGESCCKTSINGSGDFWFFAMLDTEHDVVGIKDVTEEFLWAGEERFGIKLNE
eukprot:TRINITY_DN1167_c0_g1_i5.p1 TRINITY_DN1167_c0_g1~~TRINITY_DN1167_c0_g1_i5.p1  ORF type:complete len:287 (-),score=56.15 TRINITY_DN1167_c0_g1_i5:130-990(-)